MKRIRLHRIMAFVPAVIIISLLLLAPSSKNENVVVHINGMPVPVAEFELFLNRNIAGTYNYFFQQWGAQDHPGFWKTTYGGQTPAEFAREKTIQQLLEVKVKQQLAVEMGLVPGFTFDSLLLWWEEDNLKRKAKHEAGEVVYGPIENSLAEYYQYYFSNLFIRLRDELNQTQFKIDEAGLGVYFEANKEKWFKYTPGIEVEYLEFPYQSPPERDKAYAKALAVSKNRLPGVSLSKLVDGFASVHYGHRMFTDQEITGEDNPDHQRRELAFRLEKGEARVMDGNENSSIYLMHCMDRKEDKIYPFHEVKNDVAWYYQKEKYERLIASLRSEARVSVHPSVYEGLDIFKETPRHNSALF